MIPSRNLPYLFLRVDSPGGKGPTRRAQLIEQSADGLELKSKVAVDPGRRFFVWGNVLGAQSNGQRERQLIVKSCEQVDSHSYRIRSVFAEAAESPEPNREEPSSGNAESPEQPATDYYEVLQISPNADDETIHRVYRFMAQRCHPDNAATGNAERFKQVLEAYRMLSDAETRVAYDVRRRSSTQSLQEAFGLEIPDSEADAEPAKRHAILKLVYHKMLRSPSQPGTMMRKLEEILGIAEPHLAFALWYLRQKRWIVSTDGGRIAITIEGVEEVERLGLLAHGDDRLRIEQHHAEQER